MKRGTKLIPVRFIQKNAPYNVNEIAGFPQAVVDRLIKHKKAVLYEPQSEESPDAVSGALVIPIHDKGPFFMVGDERVRGKKKAQELADEINKAAPAKG